MNRYYLAICAIFRGEAHYLDEWLKFHISVGAEHFFLYDNRSTDKSSQRLVRYMDEGFVTRIDWPISKNTQGAQKKAYQHCLEKFGQTSHWIAFIDLDEFLFSPRNKLSKILQDYENFCGVVAHWQCYGSSGHVHRPEGLVTDNFLFRARSNWARNRRVKSIVDPSRTLAPNGVHFFHYRNQAKAVDENQRPITVKPTKKRKLYTSIIGWWPDFPIDPYASQNVIEDPRISVNTIRINHYTIKSYEEYTSKKIKMGKKKYDERFFRYHDRNEVYDPILKGTVQPDP